MTAHPAHTAGLMRRLAAMFYDTVLLVALLMLAGLPVVAINNGPPRTATGHLLYQLYLGAIIAIFFAWFWIHGGQTLGMRAWRLRLVRRDGGRIDLRRAALRLAAALVSLSALGLGYFWVLVDREHLAWHDRLSGTRLEVLPRRGAPSAARSRGPMEQPRGEP